MIAVAAVVPSITYAPVMPVSTRPSPPGVCGTLLIRLATPQPKMRMPTGIQAPKARNTVHSAASSNPQARADQRITAARSRMRGGSAARSSTDCRERAGSPTRRSTGSATVKARSRKARDCSPCRATTSARPSTAAAVIAAAANTRGASPVVVASSAPTVTIMLRVRMLRMPTPIAPAVAAAPSAPSVFILRAANNAPAGPPPGSARLSVNAPIDTCSACG